MSPVNRESGEVVSVWGSRALPGLVLAPLLISAGCSDEIVTVASVAMVEVTPGSETLIQGGERQFQAVPRDAQGRPLQDREVLWSVVPSSRGSVANGRFMASQPGEAEIRATVEGVSGASVVTVLVRVEIADPNLEAAVRTAVGKPSGPLSEVDLAGLTSLTADEQEISNVSGLEYATNLTELHLNGNEIQDVSALSELTSLRDLRLNFNRIQNLLPLSGLTDLRLLVVAGNGIINISPVSGLSNLTFLDLGGNSIASAGPLSGLTNLEVLSIAFNDVTDLSPLSGLTNLFLFWAFRNNVSDVSAVSGLTNLEDLRLEENQIRDVAPLRANPGLGAGAEVNLLANPLGLDALCEDILALMNRGAQVLHDGGCGFNATFEGSAPGWTAESGNWSFSGGQSLSTTGVPDMFSIFSFGEEFADFEYEARVRRAGCNNCANGFFVRAAGPLGGTFNAPENYYIFSFTRAGSFSVFRSVNRTVEALQIWASSAAINQGTEWNILRVVLRGTRLTFFINDVQVWTGTDSLLTSGRVALQMARSDTSTGDQFLVDWARLAFFDPSGSIRADPGLAHPQLPELGEAGSR